MLSKKMMFSLTSLITILALAFAVMPAMAADDFDATFSVVRVSAKSDHNAVYGQDIAVTLTFGAQVDGTKATLTIFVEDKFGAQTSIVLPATSITPKDLNTVRDGLQNDNKSFIFTIPASATDYNDVKVHLHVAKGVKEIVPLGSAKSSKEGKLTIDLVGPEAVGAPTVMSIALAPGVIVPAAGYTGATIDVIITLSEAPKEFKAAHINITEATVADPVALDPVPGQTASEIQAQLVRAGVGNPPRFRGLYDESGADPEFINPDRNADPPLSAEQLAVRMTHGGIHRAINDAAQLRSDDAYTYEVIDPDTGEAHAGMAFIGALATTAPAAGTIDTSIPTKPSETLTASAAHPKTVTVVDGGYTFADNTAVDDITFPAGTDRTVKPTQPKPGDFTTHTDYQAGLALFNARRSLYAEYMTEKNEYDAYVDAVALERTKDDYYRYMYYETVFGTSVPQGTGRDTMLHPFSVKITPKYANKNAVVVKVKEWEGQTIPAPGESNKYTPPVTEAEYVEGVDKLIIKIGKEVLADKTAGIEVKLLNEGIIPKDGYLVVAKDTGGSAVRNPGDAKKSPASTARQPFALTYNLISGGLPNLESFLINGGTIDLVAPQTGLVISEIMWGTDASIADSFKSQYIEIRNTSGAEIKMGDGTHKLIFYPAGSTLPAASTVKDRVGTVGSHGYWSVAGKGQSGRTGLGEAPGDVVAITPTEELISMQRAADAASATGLAADGTDPMSWAASAPPGLNFDPNKEGQRVGSPGRAPIAYPTAPTPPTPAATVPIADAADIMITEIMVDTEDGRLPQWIELTNVSGAEKRLDTWSLIITNSEDDPDDKLIGTTVSIDLEGTLGVGGGMDAGGTMGKSLVLVGGTARSSANLTGSDRVVDISSQVDERGRYTFISTVAFEAKLLPPQKTGVVTYGDTAGNLDDGAAAWEIPMSENGRSSLIRREMLSDGTATMGTAANGWILASSTALISGPATWYGSDEDAGTPGYDAGGPLPVELSHFRPARDKATGAVVITWSTQSELNNAGFFIKRSNQKDGQFKVINPTMIAGAGTTSEKQFYTYTDTTAQPNVVYYYQIEDVSLDGNRQTLTRGTRLRGHIGAAGKLTSTWGELKSSNE